MGGCAAGLLITDQAAAPIRATRDVDLIVEILSLTDYRHLEESLRQLALLTYLPLKKYRTIPRFLGYARRVEAQLAETKGIVGYSLRTKFMQRSFWTLSVWESEEALQAFIHEGFHTGVMSVLTPDMAATNFVRWKIKGSECPPSWEEALRRPG